VILGAFLVSDFFVLSKQQKRGVDGQLPTEATEAISVTWNPKQPIRLPLREKNVSSAPPEVRSPSLQECDARVGGYRLRYLRAGSGPALLLIHGLMGYSFSWRYNIAALSRDFTVYAPDLIGTGFSEHALGADYTLRGAAERMLEFADQLGVKSLNLLGTSHGGGVATQLASLAIERGRPKIERLILVAAINPWSRHGKKRVAVLSNPLAALAFRMGWDYTRRYHSFFLRRMYGDPGKVTAATLNGYAAGLAQAGTAEYGLAVVRHWRQSVNELRELYPRLKSLPTLIVWGDRDCAVSPDSAQMLQRALPASELVMLPQIGHLPYEECPEEFNRILLDFLRRPVS